MTDDHTTPYANAIHRAADAMPQGAVSINRRVEQVERQLERERVEDQLRIEAEEAEWRANRAGSTEQRS